MIEIRPARNSDYRELHELLVVEDIQPCDHAFRDCETWVCLKDSKIAGFFTLGSSLGVPYLIHFCVNLDYRGHTVFRRLAYWVKKRVKEMGKNEYITNVPKEKSDVKKFVETYYKAKPYGFSDGQYYYLTYLRSSQNGKT